MKLFIYEFISAGGMPSAPSSLRAEGWAMLSALVEDFAQINGVETLTLIDKCCARAVGRFCRLIGPGEEPAAFVKTASSADMVFVIAPDFEEILANRTQWVLDLGKPILGSSVPAINLASDKVLLAQCWLHLGIPTPPTFLLAEGNTAWKNCPFPAVCKPRYGAGSQDTFLIRDANELASRLSPFPLPLSTLAPLLQPHIPGFAASVTFLIGPRQCLALEPTAQLLSDDGRFRYLGSRLPLERHLARRAVELAERALAAIEGLAGFVGVDLILGDSLDGSQDYAIEVNPRPTTSYLGLRQLSEDNLAEAALRIAQGRVQDPVRWKAGHVQFSLADAADNIGPCVFAS